MSQGRKISFFIRLGIFSLIAMIPLHFLLLHFKIYFLGLLPAALLVGIAFISFGLAFLEQFFASVKKDFLDFLLGLFLIMAGFGSIGIDFSFSFPENKLAFTMVGIVLFISTIGVFITGLAKK